MENSICWHIFTEPTVSLCIESWLFIAWRFTMYFKGIVFPGFFYTLLHIHWHWINVANTCVRIDNFCCHTLAIRFKCCVLYIVFSCFVLHVSVNFYIMSNNYWPISLMIMKSKLFKHVMLNFRQLHLRSRQHKIRKHTSDYRRI